MLGAVFRGLEDEAFSGDRLIELDFGGRDPAERLTVSYVRDRLIVTLDLPNFAARQEYTRANMEGYR